MAQHKRPTQVEIAPVTEQSEFREWVERYWKPGAALCLGVAAFILGRHFLREQHRQESHEGWNSLRKELVFTSPGASFQLPGVASLAAAAERLRSTPAGPWARALEAQKRLEENDFSGAQAAVDGLRHDFPNHPLVKQPLDLGSGSVATGLVDVLTKRITDSRRWREEHGTLFANPDLPSGSPRVRLTTSKGKIVLGLYAEIAPRHVDNFLSLCRSGYYNGTKFHRIVAEFMVQGGDPNSKEGPVETWGQGGPDHRLDPEIKNLRHFGFVLSTAKQDGETQENGSQFFITTANAHHLDTIHTVFGVVLEGKDVVEAIGDGKVVAGTDRPEQPVILELAEPL